MRSAMRSAHTIVGYVRQADREWLSRRLMHVPIVVREDARARFRLTATRHLLVLAAETERSNPTDSRGWESEGLAASFAMP